MRREATSASERGNPSQPPVFPNAGARARLLKRFERDLEQWLSQPEGRFARWRAERQLEATERQGAISR